MSNVWHCGQENASTTSGHEWDTLTGTGTANTATCHGGGALGTNAFRVLHAVAAVSHFQHQFGVAGNTGTDWYFFTAFRWDTLPGAECIFVQINNTIVPIHSLRLTTGGVLRLYKDDTATQVGSDGPTLSTGVWYWGGMAYTPGTGAMVVYLAQEGQALLPVISGTTASAQASFRIRCGIITSTTGDVFFDDCVVNNSAGTVNNVIPQETYLTALRPDAAGDFNEGVSGSFADVDEQTTDEATTIATLDVNNDRLDVNIGSPAVPVNRENWLVKFAGVWVRARGASASSASWRRRFKSQGSGTLLESATLVDATGAFRNGGAVPIIPTVAETDPQTAGLHLTYERLTGDGPQIGTQAIDAAPDVQVTQMWLYVAWSRGPVITNPAVVESMSSIGLVPGPLLRVA